MSERTNENVETGTSHLAARPYPPPKAMAVKAEGNMSRIGALVSAVATLLVLSSQAAAGTRSPAVQPSPPEAHQFDFWAGEWTVNLREFQPDATWKDSRRAAAKLYPLLGGKVLVELWNEKDIKGFSYRYFDAAKRAWVLSLHWPAPNQSATSRLEGTFRHGRGEFFRKITNGPKEVLARYTFSDITPDSVRWDDAYSSDGGKTWSPNWIMEFSRTGPAPALQATGGSAHTFETGARCDREEFRRYEFLAGRHQAFFARAVHGQKAAEPERGTLTGYRILDGCAVMAEAEYSVGGRPHQIFMHVTFDTARGVFELQALDSDRASPARTFRSRPGAQATELFEDVDAHLGARVEIRANADGSILWTESPLSAGDRALVSP